MRVWTLTLLSLAGCLEPTDGPHPRITDQLGDEFFWVCPDDEGECEVHRIAGVSPPLPECEPGQGEARYAAIPARLIAVAPYCYVEGSMSGAQMDRPRYVICDDDSGCPDGQGSVFECRSGFCQNADTVEYPPELLWAITLSELCYADTPRFADRELDPAIEAAIDAACPGRNESWYAECVDVPAQCPDPR